MILIIIYSVGFILTISLLVRGLLALLPYQTKIRALIRARPWLHLTLFLLVIAFISSIAGGLLPVLPKRKPGTFRHVESDFYWRIISSSRAKEIARKDGIIFLCYFERHGPIFFAIREEEAKSARQSALRKLVSRIANEIDRPDDEFRMTRLAMLTNRQFADIESFREWWNQAAGDFVFNENAHLRLRDYYFGKSYPDERSDRLRKMLDLEREIILEGKYRVRFKPQPEAAPNSPPP